MDRYIDIELRPDADMRLNVLLNTVYTKFHKALCDLKSNYIGVSFPKYELTLGNVLRVHGESAALHDLQGINWLGGMIGYCNVSDILSVPSEVKFRNISRKQSTMSNSKLQRLIKRGSISADDVKRYKAELFKKGLDNPYVELISASNNQKYRRYFEFGQVVDSPIPGEFDQFGLSKTATIPWF